MTPDEMRAEIRRLEAEDVGTALCPIHVHRYQRRHAGTDED